MDDTKVLDFGYVKLIETWGSDERIIEAARMSTGKGFLGWEARHREGCRSGFDGRTHNGLDCCVPVPGDEKLLAHLWKKVHSSPFEFAGMVIEVQAPIMVFREWHRHRTQSYSERSARYAPLPDENYAPTVERMMMNSKANKQAGTADGADELTEAAAIEWQGDLASAYDHLQKVYAKGLKIGVPKELARLPVPVARYSTMRACANLLNWKKFLKLRCAPDAQWEIRQFANAVAAMVKLRFPRTYDVARESLGLP